MTVLHLEYANIVSIFTLNTLVIKMSKFFINYNDEESCKMFFKQKKEEAGVECACCGSLCHYWIEKETRWRCKGCGKGISLKTRTVMENSNLGYKVWLWALYLMSLTKKGFSALEMQRLLGHRVVGSIQFTNPDVIAIFRNGNKIFNHKASKRLR